MDKCVLVVDDNDFNRELVRDILEDEDIAVYEADGGETAIGIMKSEQADDIDVILMDMRMPVMDGVSATSHIRALGGRCESIPIIAMTANTYESDTSSLSDAGMNGLITKPVDVDTLTQQIAKLAGW